ncbi:carbon-nitrogen family hydrolase [Caldalkalibacillus thermarum TA2.A1]|uniref:Carbon-nitrogen family hydrolase n=2 Tax=Caldalkalibacillus thermarum (strain TA2.A1) TaxID=986075 RepID=A0A8X8I8H6_CALTT|nr:carbon-nitrogen family hydrolase [Caldalkalibacillus thermarum]QZT33433.1 carbon-nitrogen family hydrolase [Caldalkalibacillus thermarum TA2.A1]GGK18089.1 hydrolase [Caldalkalibacillus thermarum]
MVASVQFEIRDRETKDERIERMIGLLKKLKGYDLIVLPEIWATGYFSFDRYREEAEPISGPFVQRMAQVARQLNSVLFAGSFVEQAGEQYYNTGVLFDANGDLLATYRKIHLFRYGSQEGELLTRGEEITVTETKVGRVGLSTCYDLRFPELFRKQVDLGVEIFLVTSAWPHQRLAHWQLFNAVRAVENQCFLISANCVGHTRHVLLGGYSQVVDPWGVVRAQAGESEAIVTAEIDLDEVKRIREHFPQLKHRVLQ